MPMPVSRMQSVFGASSVMDTDPLRVYLSALESTCSMTNSSHFSSVMTLTFSGVYSSRSLRRMNCEAYLRTTCRTISSSA